MLQADDERIASHPAHLGGTGKVAFQVLVYENRGVPRAAGHFGLTPFRRRGNHAPEFFDHSIVRPNRSETAAGAPQIGNQIVGTQNSSEIVRTYRLGRNPSGDPKAIRDWQR